MPSSDLLLPQAMVDPASLHPHPRNPRLHNDLLLRERVGRLGQYAAVVVNRGTLTGRPDEILRGHGTTRAFRDTQPPSALIQVSYVDVDDATALRILLGDNASSDSATNDEDRLLAALAALPDLSFTGFTDEFLEQLTSDLAIADEDPVPPPPPPRPPVAPPDTGGGALLVPVGGDPRPGAEERQAPRETGTRVMVLEFSPPVFKWMQEQLTAAAAAFDVESNADAVVELIALRALDDKGLHHARGLR